VRRGRGWRWWGGCRRCHIVFFVMSRGRRGFVVGLSGGRGLTAVTGVDIFVSVVFGLGLRGRGGDLGGRRCLLRLLLSLRLLILIAGLGHGLGLYRLLDLLLRLDGQLKRGQLLLLDVLLGLARRVAPLLLLRCPGLLLLCLRSPRLLLRSP
jgi:hypothetical protein